MTQLNFDASKVDPSGSFDALPAGWYKAAITASEMKQTNAGNGQYLKLQFQILDGEYANRVVFANLTLNHPNTTTVEIAQRNLSAICHAVGVMTVNDSQQLHDKPLLIKLNKTTSDQYGEQNDVKEYKAMEGSAPPPATSQGSQQGPTGQSQPGSASAPWDQMQ